MYVSGKDGNPTEDVKNKSVPMPQVWEIDDRTKKEGKNLNLTVKGRSVSYPGPLPSGRGNEPRQMLSFCCFWTWAHSGMASMVFRGHPEDGPLQQCRLQRKGGGGNSKKGTVVQLM
jgi:hypothetical protein